MNYITDYCTNSSHMFYLVCNSLQQRNQLIDYLKEKGIHSVFHYLSLHNSPFYKANNIDDFILPHSDYYTDNLLRLPLYYELQDMEIKTIIENIISFQTN